MILAGAAAGALARPRPTPTLGAAASTAEGKVDCDRLLTFEEVGKACGLKVSAGKPPEPGQQFDVGVCARRFVDRNGREIRLTVDHSSSAEENHDDGEEVIRVHGDAPEYHVIGASPVLGAVWSAGKDDVPAAHAAVFRDRWRVELVAEPSPTGRGSAIPCKPDALGTLALKALDRLH